MLGSAIGTGIHHPGTVIDLTPENARRCPRGAGHPSIAVVATHRVIEIHEASLPHHREGHSRRNLRAGHPGHQCLGRHGRGGASQPDCRVGDHCVAQGDVELHADVQTVHLGITVPKGPSSSYAGGTFSRPRPPFGYDVGKTMFIWARCCVSSEGKVKARNRNQPAVVSPHSSACGKHVTPLDTAYPGGSPLVRAPRCGDQPSPASRFFRRRDQASLWEFRLDTSPPARHARIAFVGSPAPPGSRGE
jgi:hypothetical protein